ncbi:phage tail length tape measure family protein [Rhizobium sp. CFBP 13726]|uniref:phage tail length tape measure family protein n=1 Tax=Rhizobium sp. CFBP 13726 TaxID=2775296 RepID=UPI001783FAD2|nr:phage tail length tape measure family protein [Rhizobium sp. CFBP 13726]MBD8651479.1 phage tail length tape measure family protein [Rhizobium sp. CFBP 13726]
MADVATLGIQVTTQGADKAAADLTKVSGAAARAEAATEGLAVANRGASGAAEAAAKAYVSEGAAAQSASRQIEMMGRAANQNVSGLAKNHNTANLAAQGFDIVTTAAGGMSAGLIGMQQGLQIAQVAMTTTGGFAKALGAAFLAMLSPVTLVAVALTTLFALGIQTVNWAKLAASALLALADVLDEIAPYAVAAAAALALLYAPAIIGGVVQVIALLGRLVTQLGVVAIAFLAANPAIAFVAGIVAAVTAANIFRDELTRILGFDIVDAAKKGANLVIGSFVAAFHDLQFVWNQFPNIIGSAAIGAANATISAIEQMINGATGMLNGMIQSINSTLGSLPGGIQIGQIGNVDFGKIANPYADALSSAVGDRNKQIQQDLSTDWIGQLSTGIQQGASKAAGALKDLAGWMTKVDEKKSKKAAGGGKSEAERYDSIVDSANRRIASLQSERDALGLTEEAALKLRYETDLLNQAQQRGITLTDAQKSQLSGLAEQMASLEYGTKMIKERMDFAKDATRGFIDDFRSGLENGEGLWKSFGNAAMGVLDKITDKLLDDVLDAVFKVSGAGSGAGGGGIFGFLGSLFTGGGSGSGASAPSWLNSGFDTGISKYANGTMSARSGVALVGEKGPELVRFRGGEQVVSNHQTVSAANQNSGGSVMAQASSPSEIRVTGDFRTYVDENGNWQAKVENISATVSKSAVNQYDKDKATLYQNGQAA